MDDDEEDDDLLSLFVFDGASDFGFESDEDSLLESEPDDDSLLESEPEDSPSTLLLRPRP